MIIKSLRLKNIRSYQDQIITFPTGSVLLSGDIGSGKSTILYAIEFALFGTDLDRLSTNALLRKGENDGFVELNFQVKDQDVIIKRTLKKTKTSIQQTAGCIVTNGLKKDLMPVEIKNHIIELLGYPPELASKKKNYVFRYTVYCPQEEMKEILTDDEEDRLNTLRKVFNIDKYKKIKENSLIYIKELRSKRKEFEIKIEDLEELKTQLEQKKQILEKNNSQLSQLNPKIEILEKELQEIKNQIKEAEKKIAELNELRKQLEVISAQERVKKEQRQKNQEKIDQIKLKLVEVPTHSLEELQNKIAEEEKNISFLLEKKTSLTEQHHAIKNRIEELTKEIQTTDQKIKDLPNQRQRLDQLKAKIEDIKDYKRKQQELEKSIEQVNLALREYEINKNHSLGLKSKILTYSKCPTCYQVVPKEHKENINREENEKISLYEKRIKDCLEQKRHSEMHLASLKEEIDQGFEHEKEFERLKTEIKNFEEISRHLQEKFNELETKKKQELLLRQQLLENQQANLEEKQEQIRKNKGLLEKIKEYQRQKSLLKEFEETNYQIDRDLFVLLTQKTDLKIKIGLEEKIEEKYKELKKSLEEKQSQEKGFIMEKTRLQTEISTFQMFVESLTNEIEAKNIIKQKLTKIKELANWLNDHFLNLMTSIEKHVMARIQREFNELFQQWFSMLIEDDNMAAKLDEQFNPIIEQNGYEVDLNHLSGGERTSTALAYRLALNKVVNDVISTIKTKDLLILDEPTDGFSSQQLDKVRDVLEELGVKQTIIVSHENKIESFVDNVVRIIKREGVSEVI